MTNAAGVDPAELHAMRRDWLSVLAHAPRPELASLAPTALEGQRFEWLKRAETGLVMLRARIGNTGDRFNLGEATVTRCAVRHLPPAGSPSLGIGYLLGRDVERSEWVACLDALLQHPGLRAHLLPLVVEPLRQAVERERARQRERADTTQVRFFTLQPEAV